MKPLKIGEYIHTLVNTIGFYVDVGAWDGKTESETFCLEQLGWNGIVIEGNPQHYQKLCKNRTATPYNSFIAGSIEPREAIFERGCGSGIMDNMSEDHIQTLKSRPEARIYRVIPKLLEDVLDILVAPKHITLLKIDTEGADFEIIQSLSFTKYTFGFIALELGKLNKNQAIQYLAIKNYKVIQELRDHNVIFQHI